MSIPVVRQAPANPTATKENRQTFDALGLVCVNLVGPAGCGKTAFLEAVLPRLKSQVRVGVVEADLAATCDAQRINRCGVPVVQVLSDGSGCLLPHQLQRGMAELPLASLDLLLIENVGTTLYPSHLYLGEHLRAAMLSIAAGHLVTHKYPGLVREAQLVLLSKFGLLPHVEFDLEATVRGMRQTNAAAEIICTDTRSRVGIDRAAGWLLGYVRAQRVRQLRHTPAAASETATV